MKNSLKLLLIGIGSLVCLSVPAQTTIGAANRYSWTPNIGWIDWRANGTNSGARFASLIADGPAPIFASGYIWNGNVGWINLGDGSPANLQQYSNTTAADFGVNVDRTSNAQFFLLSGLAWGANIGWISFNVTDTAIRPRIEKATGTLRGYAWSANVGWLRLDSPGVTVNTGLKLQAAAEDWLHYN